MFETYAEAEQWLFSQVPNYQLIGEKAYHPGLKHIQHLCEHLGEPHTKFPSIHLAGTNGKGSTASLIASVLTEAGFKTGLYTSPHLLHFSERITINGQPISESELLKYVNRVFPLVTKNFTPSFFELTTAIAFAYFANQQVDVAVIETGLGGRLDATNILTPILTCITKISFDHMEFLGDTLAKIATEKAGIIKKCIPLVTNTQADEVMQVFEEKCRLANSELIAANRFGKAPQSALKGNYQVYNEQNAFAVLQKLVEMGWEIPYLAIEKGFAKVLENTPLRGRWQIISQRPHIIFDTAHNEEGVQMAMQQLEASNKRTLVVLGFVKGKAVESIIEHLPKSFEYFFAKPSIPRGLPPEAYESALHKRGLNYSFHPSVKDAFEAAKQHLSPDDQLFVGGSNFVVAEVLSS